MAYNSAEHRIDPKSGFIVDKKSGHPIGLVADPKLGQIPNAGADYPSWVRAHDSWIVRLEGRPPVTPMLGHCHVDRNTGEVTVMVADEDAAKRAMGEMPKPTPPEEVEMTRDDRLAAMAEDEHATAMNMGVQGAGVVDPSASAEIARDEAAIAEDQADIERIEADAKRVKSHVADEDAAYLGAPNLNKKLN
jgi:hypothetical protein